MEPVSNSQTHTQGSSSPRGGGGRESLPSYSSFEASGRNKEEAIVLVAAAVAAAAAVAPMEGIGMGCSRGHDAVIA